MIIRVQKRDNPFVQIDKQPLHDTRLSFKAKGILSYLLSKPNDWKLSNEQLAKVSSDGLDSVKSGVKELKQFGYVQQKRIHGPDGKFVEVEHYVYETPQTPQVENPPMVKPQVEKPPVENPPLIINELNNNDFNNKTYVAPSGASEYVSAENEETGAQSTTGNDYSLEFMTFWESYPRRKEKAKAWKQWKARLKQKHTPEQMIIAAKNYAKECDGTDSQFIKHPSTFVGPDKPFMEYLEAKTDEAKKGASYKPPVTLEEKAKKFAKADCIKCSGKGFIQYFMDGKPLPNKTKCTCWNDI